MFIAFPLSIKWEPVPYGAPRAKPVPAFAETLRAGRRGLLLPG